ncbi:MAG: hypothetical protein HY720_12285, partial [Planctomycetes bacterium]|nr:hypothetical protein [Planctomycetota bacterium]
MKPAIARRASLVSFFLALLPAVAQDPVPVAIEPPVRFAKPHLFAGHFAVEPRIPVAADLDGDGFADLACVYPPEGGILDVGFSERGQKMHAPRDVLSGLGGEAIDAAAHQAGEVAWLTREGTVGAWSGGAARVRAEGIAGADGRILPFGQGYLVPSRAGPWTLVGVGTVEGPAEYRALAAWGTTLFWVQGALFRGTLAGGRFAPETLADPAPSERIVAGDFDGDGTADVLSGTRLFLGGKPEPVDCPEVPADGVLLAADMTGDGRSDLVWCRRDGEPFQGRDILLLPSYGPGAADPDADGLANDAERVLGTDPLSRDSDADGIPDGWEVLGAGGLDLAAEGFHPAKKDVLCYVQRCLNVDGNVLGAELDRCRATYASLRIPISFHARYLPPLSVESVSGKAWWDLGNAHLPPETRGLAHYMIVQAGGGGQSAQMGDMGGCGSNALWAVFLHEFGHQIGLDHTGYYPEPWCPLYTSLMNYAYNYGFDGDYNKVHYSNGEFAAHVLKESELTEELPFPPESVGFLTKEPFLFKIAFFPVVRRDWSAGPLSLQFEPMVWKTRIDWNRNGLFDEGRVRADINTSYSTDGGTRSTIGKTLFAPALVSHQGKAYLYCVNLEGTLERRDYFGSEKWSDPQSVGAPPATGDPFALSCGPDLLVFLPTQAGVLSLADGQVFPESAGCETSGASWGGRAVLFLWREGKVRFVERRDGAWTAPADFPLASTFPPGAVEGDGGELLAG